MAPKSSSSEGGTEVSCAPQSGSEKRLSGSSSSRGASEKLGGSNRLGNNERSLEDQASCLSSWFLWYLNPLLSLGARKVLEQEDIGVPSAGDRASLAYESASKAWKEETKKAKEINEKRRRAYDAKLAKMSPARKAKAPAFREREPSVATCLMRGFGRWRLAFALFCYVLGALLGFVPVLILEDLVRHFEDSEHEGYGPTWALVIALGIVPLFISLLQTRSQLIFMHAAVFVRTAVSTLLYEKSLSVSAVGRAVTSTGQVVNIMSNDTAQLQRFINFIGLTLVAPLQIFISLFLIFQQVGNATWVGVGFMFALAPLNIVIFSIVSKMRRRVLKFSDMRVKMMNEILNGIRIIKYYAWEKPFHKEVSKIRDEELKALTALAYTTAVGFSLVLLSAPIIQPILVFVTYINIQDEPMDAATAFTTVALFNIMRFPFAFMPMGLLQFVQSRISLRRIARYLQLPELSEYVIAGPHPEEVDEIASQPGSITMKNASFSWTDRSAKLKPLDGDKKAKKKKGKKGSMRASQSSVGSDHSAMSAAAAAAAAAAAEGEGNVTADVIALKDVTCTIERGSLVAVVGSVGSGKSSFLSAILGEMETVEDSKVYMPRPDGDSTGFISYCAQTPWIVNDTLRGNILFGREFVEDRYNDVVRACALESDLEVLPAGDMTEIGERGINLSGGQKARVSLARAMYSQKTQILLLDDPLSAVDAHVGEKIFNEAITGEVSAGTTRVLVTHHVHYLPRCDTIIVLEDGLIKHSGSYEQLTAQGVDFAGAIDVSKVARESMSVRTSTVSKDGKAESQVGKIARVEDAKTKAELKRKGEKLVDKEERQEGAVASSAYKEYAKAGGICAFFCLFLFQGIARATEILASFWLALWAKESVDATEDDDPLTNKETRFYLNIYAALGMFSILCLTVRGITLAVHRLHASRTLHHNLANSILRAPVAFFDVTPTGRILNRFAADTDKVDLDLTQSIGQGITTIFSVMGAIGAIIAGTRGTFLVPLIPIGYMYFVVQKWFRKTSTELQRVTSIANSPIFADFSQTLSGTSTIRAYGEKDRFFEHTRSSFDNYNASYSLVQMVSFWLGLRLDILGGFIAAFIGGVAVATSSFNFISAGWLGLALSYAIEVTGFLKHAVRMIATIEADMNSVERILYYSHQIEAEAPDEVPGQDPDLKSWPSTGEIDIDNASMRYRDGPLVLKGISVKVNGGEKIGVVGRTGSGKSSLMNLLFRITEAEADGGKIFIDGVDTSKIGTSALRMSLSIIPQDPVMFSNTVRYNLDPFGEATETELWSVLEKVQLDTVIAALPGGLDDEVAEGGENFSQGQRQLLCIARSLLRQPKILVMDEATASIDNTTDLAIQKMIRENFSSSTVLTIAHRLNTIMDSDRILVLDGGNVAEFDTPGALLAQEDGIFRGMVEKSKKAQGEDD